MNCLTNSVFYCIKSWIHFIYGKRSTNKSIFCSTKQINREHPNAYLPLILHQHNDSIGKTPNEDKSAQPNLYKRKAMNGSSVESNSNSKANEEDTNSGPTLRTKSESFGMMDEDEEQQVKHLQSILFEEDFTQSSTSSSHDITKTQVKINFNHKSVIVMVFVRQPAPNSRFGSSLTLRGWLTKYFLIKDEDIYRRRGYDALQYVVFQRYLIYFLFALTVICVSIILPINVYAGKLQHRPDTYYRRTTILNVKNESPVIYIHALMTTFVVAMVLSSQLSDPKSKTQCLL